MNSSNLTSDSMMEVWIGIGQSGILDEQKLLLQLLGFLELEGLVVPGEKVSPDLVGPVTVLRRQLFHIGGQVDLGPLGLHNLLDQRLYRDWQKDWL